METSQHDSVLGDVDEALASSYERPEDDAPALFLDRLREAAACRARRRPGVEVLVDDGDGKGVQESPSEFELRGELHSLVLSGLAILLLIAAIENLAADQDVLRG